jgi:hypothetical protein
LDVLLAYLTRSGIQVDREYRCFGQSSRKPDSVIALSCPDIDDDRWGSSDYLFDDFVQLFFVGAEDVGHLMIAP